MPYKAFKRPDDAEDKRKRKGKNTTKNSTTSPRRIAITAAFRKKAEEAIEYRIQGYSFTQISKEMKIDRAYVYRLVDWAMNLDRVEGTDQVRALMNIRYEGMIAAVMTDALDGNHEAQEQARRNMGEYAKLNGLAKPQKIEHSGEINNNALPPVFIIYPEDAKL